VIPPDPRFELVGELGRGGMGVVYRAIDRERGGEVALKALSAVGSAEVLRLKREFRAMCDVRHPNLVRLGELFERDGRWFFTMELVDGVDFLSWVGAFAALPEPTPAPPITGIATQIEPAAAHAVDAARAVNNSEVTRTLEEGAPVPAAASPRPPPAGLRPPPAFDEARLRAALRGVAEGLAGLHRAGLAHRDIKPSNIKIDAAGRVVLLDFGVAAELTDDDADVAGTLAFMAPEQTARRATPASDWYAVGVMLFRAMTGTLPFPASREALLVKASVPAPSPDAYVRDLPRDLVALCLALLRADPATRAGANELRAVLGADLPLRAPAPPPPPFVGRNRERARLAAALSRQHAGGPRAVVVSGPSGVGKTALVRRFLEDAGAAEPSLLVFEGRCDERETVPFNALDGVVDGLARWLARRGDELPAAIASVLRSRDAAELARLFPVLGEVATASARRRGVTVEDPRAPAVDALRALLDAVARTHRVVVLIDDAHWADADSCALLSELLAPPAPPLLLIATARGAGDPPLVRGLRLPVEDVALGGLDTADAVALATAAAGAPIDAAAIAREAEGHPMYIAELARFAAEQRAPAGSLDDALWARACDLAPAARHLLHVVIADGAALPLAVAIRAAGLGPAEAEEAVAELRAARLVRAGGADDVVEPYHDRIREALTGRFARPDQTAVHLALARALAVAGALPERLAHHWAAGGEPAEAARAAEAAALRAADTLAFERAAEWLAMALELGRHDPETRRALLIERADALTCAGHPEPAGAAFLEAARTGEPAELERLDLRRRAAERLLSGGYLSEGMAVARDLLAEVGMPLPATRRAAVFSLVWRNLRLGLLRLRWTPRSDDELAPAERLRLDTCWSATVGLSMCDPIRGTSYAARMPVMALRAGEPRRIALALAAAAFAAAGMNQRRRLRRLTEAIGRAATQTDAREAHAYVTLAEAARAFFFDNDWAGTVALARRGLDVWTDAGRGHTWEADLFEQFVAWGLATMGEYDSLADHIDRVVRGARRRGDRFLEISFRVQFPQGYLLADRVADARADVDDALASWVTPEGVDPISNQLFWAVKARTIIALYAGRAEAEAVELDADWARVEDGPLWAVPAVRTEGAVWCCAAAIARAGEARRTGSPQVKANLARARRYLKIIARSPLPVSRILVPEIGSAIAHLQGDEAGAIARLREALPLLEAAAMPSTAAIVRWRLGQLLGGDQGAALIDDARAWMRAKGVVRPDRFVAATLPGFSDD